MYNCVPGIYLVFLTDWSSYATHCKTMLVPKFKYPVFRFGILSWQVLGNLNMVRILKIYAWIIGCSLSDIWIICMTINLQYILIMLMLRTGNQNFLLFCYQLSVISPWRDRENGDILERNVASYYQKCLVYNSCSYLETNTVNEHVSLDLICGLLQKSS